MSISYEGIGQLAVTFPADDCVEGKVCLVDGNGNAAKCSAGDTFCGVVHTKENGMAAVIVEGFVTVSYTGTAPGYGICSLVADSNGGVMYDSDGIGYLVVEVNTTNKTCTIKL